MVPEYRILEEDDVDVRKHQSAEKWIVQYPSGQQVYHESEQQAERHQLAHRKAVWHALNRAEGWDVVLVEGRYQIVPVGGRFPNPGAALVFVVNEMQDGCSRCAAAIDMYGQAVS